MILRASTPHQRPRQVSSFDVYTHVTHVTTRLTLDAIGELPLLGHFPMLESSTLAGHTKVNTLGHTQGFITSEGQFVDRDESYRIAKNAGQFIFPEGVTPTPGTLYTEDLW
jgi:hypothetical protein